MILETKLNLPQPKPGALLRTGLIDLIKNNLDKKLILVCAGAGYGKTTLLAQLFQIAQLPAVFVALDKGDSDLLTFYSYLVRGIERLSAGTVPSCSELIEQGGQIGGNHELLMGTLINELLRNRKEELFIGLDDYHHLTDGSPVHQALDYFIDHLPDTVHVIIASRTNVQFANYAKWVAKQDALGLNRGDLVLKKNDLRELLASGYRQEITDQEISQILRHTEGWITGVQLILRHALKEGRGKTVSETMDGYLAAELPAGGGLFEYFVNDIFSGEAAGTKDFLVKSSILDVMADEACGVILGVENAGKLLKELERRNFFISRIGQGEYRYHRLFRDFLQRQIQNEEEKKSLHLKAAAYYQKRGMIEQAIDHYLEAGSYRHAARAVAAVTKEMIQRARLTLLNDWFGKLPDDMLAKSASVLCEKGWALLACGNPGGAEVIFLQTEQLLKQQSACIKSKCLIAGALLGLSKIHWQRGENKKALDNIYRAGRICPKAHKVLNSEIVNMTGVILQTLGDFKKARSCLAEVRQITKYSTNSDAIRIELNSLYNDFVRGESGNLLGACKAVYARMKDGYFYEAGVAFANVATPAVIAGDTGWAEECLKRGWELCGLHEDVRSKAALEAGFGILYIYQEKYDQARDHLLRARELFAERQWPKYEANALLHLARLERYCGRYDQALKCIEQAQSKQGTMENLMALNLQIEAAQSETSRGRFVRADRELGMTLRRAVNKGYGCEAFRARLARAANYLRQGKKNQAIRLQQQLIKTSNDKGYHGILILELRHNQALLESVLACRAGKKYLEPIKDRLTAGRTVAMQGVDIVVGLFGSLRLNLPDARPVRIKWHTRKSASLFAYLLLHKGRLCEREELMNVLWPRFDLKQADRILRTTVSMLKKNLSTGLADAGLDKQLSGSLVIHQERGYRLNPQITLRSDAEEFDRLCLQAGTAKNGGNIVESSKCSRQGIELYQDCFLANLGERWCEEYREHYEKQYLGCLKRLAAFDLEDEKYDQAIAWCRKYLSKDPYSEEVRITLWKALNAAQRKGEIKKDYVDLRFQMKKELKEKPSPMLEQAYRHLIAS